MSRKERKQAKREYDNSQRQESAIAGPCTACPALLEAAGRSQKTRVYAVKGQIRFCRCDNCGHTWKKPIPMETKSA
jgi:hypothetical protein